MKYAELRRKIRAPFFTLQDLRLHGLKAFSYQFSLWQKQGHLVKIKNGVYAFAEQLGEITPEELAALLYSPGYISLEKALARYGFIPEMVYAITSVTPKTTRTFKNKIGTFIYRHIKPELFFGYLEIKGAGPAYLLAEPEKALLDFLYLNLGRIKSADDLTGFRLNREAINRTISRDKLTRYCLKYNNPKLTKIIKALI